MKPNFFIVGAPKSGTTALSTYLGEHPNIFMSTPKEPNFFCKDFPIKSRAANLEGYLKLFKTAKPHHFAIGEASVWYLYSNEAAEQLQRFAPNARIIIMLRNPVDIAYSLHSQLLWTLDENEPEFDKAWGLQSDRRNGKNIPVHCQEPAFLQYGAVAMLGFQVQRFFHHFPKDQIHLIFFDDFKNTPSNCYFYVLRFLALPDDKRGHFPVVNENKGHRSALIARFTQRPPKGIVSGIQLLKNAVGIEKFGVLDRIKTINNRKFKRKPIGETFRKQLIQYYRDDIELLESIIGRNLDIWKN